MSVCGPIAGSVILPNAGGFVGYFIVRKNLEPWYKNLNKPKWSPPTWAFSPMWVALYSGIGYGSYLVYKSGNGFEGPAKLPLIMYGTNLAFNWAYCPIFFGCKNLKMAVVNMGFVDITALATGYLFYKINKTAGYLFIPYFLWLGLATALSYKVYKLNKPDGKSQ